MVATVLGFIMAFFQALPKIIEVFNELQKKSDAVATENANKTALERFNEKRKSTTDFILEHTNDAIDKLRDANANANSQSEGKLQT